MLREHLADGRRGVEPAVLGEVAEVVRRGDVAAVGLLSAGDDADEGRLAGAVLTDQADTLAGRDGEVDAVEDEAGVVGLGQVTDDERGRHESSCGGSGHVRRPARWCGLLAGRATSVRRGRGREQGRSQCFMMRRG